MGEDGSTPSCHAQPRRAALVMAHPGHELRIHGWVEQTRPLVFILTDGSGGSGRPRLATTARTLDQAGARRGSLFGRFPDAAWYTALLERDVGFFVSVVEEIALALVSNRIDLVVGDPLEGYNPVHDVCRLLTARAAALAAARCGRWVADYEYSLIASPDDGPPVPGAIQLHLDAQALDRKLAAAAAVAAMGGEVARAIETAKKDAFRPECLRPATPWRVALARVGNPPHYETFGQRQVAEGRYREVVRCQDHFLPVAEGLERLVQRRAA